MLCLLILQLRVQMLYLRQNPQTAHPTTFNDDLRLEADSGAIL